MPQTIFIFVHDHLKHPNYLRIYSNYPYKSSGKLDSIFVILQAIRIQFIYNYLIIKKYIILFIHIRQVTIRSLFIFSFVYRFPE